ncbi:RNA polymerase recycling motor HelD [Paenibacillus sp. CAU 1782]
MINAEDWKKEEERLKQVTEKLEHDIAELEPEVSGLHNQVVDIRRQFWEEVTVNTSTHEDFEETFYSIRQQEALLSERERSHGLRVRQWKSMKRLQASPYFGRIDFQEDGTGETEAVYIGVSSFLDSDGMNFLIYDWRTPIASMYYDSPPGPAGYATPGGHINGEINLKRQYQITGDQLHNVFDTSLTIGDEMLQQVLGKGSDNAMKSIVATIQKEQNIIIRDDHSRMLIVQGVAGSGKTSAALQRVAYLLYKHRERLKADQIVLFSPNPMFNSYVSTVLPELGEENMLQMTFQEYLDHWLGDSFAVEDSFDQLEYVLSRQGEPGYEARLAAIQFKASERYLHALQRYVLELEKEGMVFNAITFRGRELISAQEMSHKFYSYDPAVHLSNRVAMMQEWLLRELSVLETKEREALWVRDELEYLDKDQYAEAYRKLHKEARVFSFTGQYEGANDNDRTLDEGHFGYGDREEELLRRMVVKEQFKPLRRSVRGMLFVDMVSLYRQLFDAEGAFQKMTGEAGVPSSFWPAICGQTRSKLDRGELFYEDATPYLYLKELLEDTRTNTQIRHVFVDEGQDYSMFQYAFLKKLFPRASMTVLGDFSQAIFVQSTELHGQDSPLTSLYGETETRWFTLLRGYRSTREIVEFTKSLLSRAKDVVPFNRNGRKPLLHRTANNEDRVAGIQEQLKALRDEGHLSIGIITKTIAEGQEAFQSLTTAGCQGLKLVTKTTPTFEKGVLVLPAYLAKGVEFDAVILYDASSETYGRESERKLFYTACTRAMHRLTLYAVGNWSPFIETVDRSLYDEEQTVM